MFGNFFKANHHLLSSLAKTWLDSGATSFSVWSDNMELDRWAVSENGSTAYDKEDIRVKGQKIGELRLTGLKTEAHSRLQMDAALISAMMDREADIKGIAGQWMDSRDQFIALCNMTHNTGKSLDFEQSLEMLARETFTLAKAEAAFIAVQLEGQAVRIAQFPKSLPDQPGLLHQVEMLYSEKRDLLFVEGVELGETKANLLLKPFLVRGAEAATLGVFTHVDRSSLSPLIKLLQTISEFACTHLENLLMVLDRMKTARLHTEMELARNVQRSLLPIAIPAVPSLDIWAETRSASVVGGDFYDLFIPPGQPLFLTVGDISGKGMPASMPMAMTRTLIRSQANCFAPPTPHEILRMTNSALYEDFTQLGMFATAFVGQYNPYNQELMFANAGHSPVIYYQANGTARLIEATDMPVGLLQNIEFENHQLCFGEGDILVVGTDGLYEARNPHGESLGFRYMLDQVANLADRSSKEIADSLLQTAVEFRGTEMQEDDQTIVVLKRVRA